MNCNREIWELELIINDNSGRYTILEKWDAQFYLGQAKIISNHEKEFEDNHDL
jgi:hypothetical protein